MSVTLSIDGPHFTGSGEIKFSEIRSKFGGGNNFGSYKRNTDTDATDPIVPEATENSAISTGNDLKFSQFRGSVKSYTATQSGTDENDSTATWPGFRMGNYFSTGSVNGPAGTGIQWNSNLNKNIKKTVNITGTCGSRTTTQAAAQLDPSSAVYNLTINVLAGARILGARGSGGIANGGNGGNGGIGLRVYNIGAKNLVVSVKDRTSTTPAANVYGGGGGGGAGTVGGNGGQGGDGLADGGTTTVYGQTACTLEAVAGGNPVCQVGQGQELVSSDFQGESPKGVFQWLCCRRSVSVVDNADTPTTGGAGGTGGNGGNGGSGEGYDGTDSEGSFGAAGGGGAAGGENAGSGGNGGLGGRGGEGGTYGSNGSPGIQGDTGNSGSSGSETGGSAGTAGGLPVGNGGTAGKAIDGLNYILNPSPPPSGTIKGNI